MKETITYYQAMMPEVLTVLADGQINPLKQVCDDVSALKVELIMLLSKKGYPPVTYNEVYQDVFAQAENFKENRVKGGDALWTNR